MFPCEMARYIAGFPREARKYGQFLTPRQRANTAPHRSGCRVIEDEDERPARPHRGLTGPVFSISGYSPDISWPVPVSAEPVLVAAAEQAEAAAAADAPLGLVAGAARPAEVVAAVAARPGVPVQLSVLAAAAVAEQASKPRLRVSTAAVAEVLSFAWAPGPAAFALALKPHCRLSAFPPAVPTDWFRTSSRYRLRQD
jgi:hypothetical protein